MKRLFIDFNENIKSELGETERKPDERLVAYHNQKKEEEYKQYKRLQIQQGQLTRKINKYKNTDPAYTQTLQDIKDDTINQKEVFKKIYEDRLKDVARASGKDYEITINVHYEKNSTKPEYRKPIQIMKSRLVGMKNPALFILKEQRKRVNYELNHCKSEIQRLKGDIFEMTPEEYRKYQQFVNGEKWLTKLKQQVNNNIKQQENARNAQSADESEEYEPDQNDTLDDDYEGDGSGGGDDDSYPMFYFPTSNSIDIM